MKRLNNTLAIAVSSLLAFPLVITSCSQDDFSGNGLIVDGESVSFLAQVPGVSTRSNYDFETEIPRDGFTVSAFCKEDKAEAGGLLPVNFEGVIIKQDVDGAYRDKDCKWPSNAGEKIGYLKFFSFHPSIADMKKRAGVGNECFIFANATKMNQGNITYDYRLTKFRVAPDIAQQADFISSIGEGNKTEHLYSGVELVYQHQLCAVQIGVWGDNSIYDLEIAGVRIGGTIVEADFSLSTEVANPASDENSVGSWIITPSSKYGHVDYVFTPGDKVVCINATEHNTKESFGSIMGNGGNAFVIPYKHKKWDYLNDSANSGNGMYFSVLMRMRERDGDRHIVFPSTDPESRPYLVFLVVDKTDGTVLKRLSAEEYNSYKATGNEEKRAYGWAALPVNTEWKPGYVYSYVLDYSKAVGLHDPADLNPALPIVGYDGVEIGIINTSEWAGGEIINNHGWGANSNKTSPDGTVWWR